MAAGVGSKHGMGSAKREREGDSDQQAVVFHPEKRTKGLMEREGGRGTAAVTTSLPALA